MGTPGPRPGGRRGRGWRRDWGDIDRADSDGHRRQAINAVLAIRRISARYGGYCGYCREEEHSVQPAGGHSRLRSGAKAEDVVQTALTKLYLTVMKK
jgi:hypothetical protein